MNDHKCLGCDGPADLFAAYCSVRCLVDDAADTAGITLRSDFRDHLIGVLANAGFPVYGDGIRMAYSLALMFRTMR